MAGEVGGSGAVPRWVKVFGVIAAALLLLFIALHMTGHGFGGHMKHGGKN